MTSEIAICVVVLVLWLVCEAVCVWYIVNDDSVEPVCDGPAVDDRSDREGSEDEPNFYLRK